MWLPARGQVRVKVRQRGHAIILALGLIPLLPTSHAQITLDGSVGPAGALQGPDFQIPAEVGQQHGGNLFHSFGEFNVHRDESATFSGPTNIDHIVGRVTGGTPSSINGRLHSQVPGADLYLMNPGGLLFGPNASLDIKGSFHATTADYIRLADGTRFPANIPSVNVLASARPEAFGFLDSDAAGIRIDAGRVAVPATETVSLIGGDIAIAGDPQLDLPFTVPNVAAPGGRINIASIRSAGEVIPNDSAVAPDITVDGAVSLGEIGLSDGALASTSAASAGTVVIRGGQLALDRGAIFADTEGDVDGAPVGVDIDVSGDLSVVNRGLIRTQTRGAGRSGSISLASDRIEVTSAGQILSDTASASITALAGDVGVHAREISIVGDGSSLTGIGSVSRGEGDAGRTTVVAENIHIENGGFISSATLSAGRAGVVDVTATNHLVITGFGSTHSNISSSALFPSTGSAGSTTVRAGDISISNGGTIASNTFSSGHAGTVRVAADNIEIRGEASAFATGITTSSQEGAAGSAGNLRVEVAGDVLIVGGENNSITGIGSITFPGSRAMHAGTTEVIAPGGIVTVRAGGSISSGAASAGASAGNVTVHADQLVVDGVSSFDDPLFDGPIPSNVSSSTENPLAGAGGSVTVRAKSISLTNGGLITARSAGFLDAGDVIVATARLSSRDAAISTQATRAGGGNIEIDASGFVELLGNSRITTNVVGTNSNAGNIQIDKPLGLLLDDSRITANASQGKGGNVVLAAGLIGADAPLESVITATGAVSGKIQVDTPTDDSIAALTVLPAQFADAARVLGNECVGRTPQGGSRLVYRRYQVLPDSPYVLRSPFTDRDSWQETAPPTLTRVSDPAQQSTEHAVPPRSPDVPLSYKNQSGHVPTIELILQAYQRRALGEITETFAVLRDALARARTRQANTETALVLSALSDTYLALRQGTPARSLAAAAVFRARGQRDRRVQATALNQFAIVEATAHRYEDAILAYQEALGLAAEETLRPLRNKLRINAAHAYLSTGHWAKAFELFDKALSETLRRADSTGKSSDLLALGHLGQRLALPTHADVDDIRRRTYAAFAGAWQVARKTLGTRAQSYALGHLGELYAEAERPEEARWFFERALFAAAQVEAPEIEARWQWRLGQLHQRAGRLQGAENALQKAATHYTSIQSAFLAGVRGNPQYLRETVRGTYLDLAETLLLQAAASSNENETNRLLRATQKAMERFKSAELKDYFADPCLAEQEGKSIVFGDDRPLPPGTAAIYPIVFTDRLVTLLSLPDGTMHPFAAPVSRERLEKTISAFRRQLSQLGNPRAIRKSGWRLYRWLLEPLEQELERAQVDTIVVVPDELIRSIPYAALYDGDKFLVDRYALVVTPGLTLTDPQPFVERNHRFLLNGLTEGAQGFAPLPHVAEEVTEIAALYESTLLLDERFRRDDVEAQLGRTAYTGVLFATHGEFGGDASESFLLTHDGRITLDELDRLLRLTDFRAQPVELLVLSACRTADGDDRAALGLAGVAVKAGARSAVASLWSVNDASTAELVPAFLENLKNRQLSKARALQLAQQRLLASGTHAHPFHWAPFILIGNWL